jgi:hypothetical protein
MSVGIVHPSAISSTKRVLRRILDAHGVRRLTGSLHIPGA